ncbi:MAG: hypothetical protein HY363_02740 [Candidatus Aenigmarchaeota archaeon]|nr:hypothetical protein [Candidatus Aenigmarchaeota archaeon]
MRRFETFADAFHQKYTAEYERRTDPNNFSQDKYRALQQLGELQRRVEDHLIDRVDARERIEREELDESALRAVRTIAQNAAQKALRTGIPEISVIENLPDLGIREIEDDEILDYLHPRVNAGISISGRELTIEPSFSMGPYKITYTTDYTFRHRFTLHHDQWYLRMGLEHDRHMIHNANASIGYSFDSFSGVSVSYLYATPEEHMLSFGFSKRF